VRGEQKGVSKPMHKKFLRYNPHLKQIARKLRNQSTLSEVLLWRELKGKKILGYDFHRQKPIEEYVVDFFCPRLMLAIEIDGSSHIDKIKEDEGRQKKIESMGIRFLRFQDNAVKQDIEAVIFMIRNWIIEHEKKSTHP